MKRTSDKDKIKQDVQTVNKAAELTGLVEPDDRVKDNVKSDDE